MVASIVTKPTPSPEVAANPWAVKPAKLNSDPIKQAQGDIRDATFGQQQRNNSDPYQAASMDYLKGVVGGSNVPYTDSVKNSILAQHGSGAATAEAAQMESLRQSLGASGGSIYDPAYQNASREAMSQRQGSNLDAAGQLEATAGLANQQAQQQGAMQLAAARGAQTAQSNQLGLAGADHAARVFNDVPSAGAPGAPGAVPGQMTPAQISAQISGQNQGAMSATGIGGVAMPARWNPYGF